MNLRTRFQAMRVPGNGGNVVQNAVGCWLLLMLCGGDKIAVASVCAMAALPHAADRKFVFSSMIDSASKR